MKQIQPLKLLISLSAPFLAGGIGGVATSSAVNSWYSTIQKPLFSPPNTVFGPVWTLLYLLMGISLYMVWTAKKPSLWQRKGLMIFAIQLVLNTLWSLLFFGLKNPLLAFVNIIVLWIMILLTITHFYRVNKTASYLLWPYLAWVSFATLLNFWIVILN